MTQLQEFAVGSLSDLRQCLSAQIRHLLHEKDIAEGHEQEHDSLRQEQNLFHFFQAYFAKNLPLQEQQLAGTSSPDIAYYVEENEDAAEQELGARIEKLQTDLDGLNASYEDLCEKCDALRADEMHDQADAYEVAMANVDEHIRNLEAHIRVLQKELQTLRKRHS